MSRVEGRMSRVPKNKNKCVFYKEKPKTEYQKREKQKTTVDTKTEKPMSKVTKTREPKNPMSENIYRESNATCLHVVPR